MKIYMDVCCFCRPFDDLQQDRVYFESEAVLTIIDRCKTGEWLLFSSAPIMFELSQSPDMHKLLKIQELYAAAREFLPFTEDVEKTAFFLRTQGIKRIDSLHVALAKYYAADVFLTTDDRLLRLIQSLKIDMKAYNPAAWLWEVLNNE